MAPPRPLCATYRPRPESGCRGPPDRLGERTCTSRREDLYCLARGPVLLGERTCTAWREDLYCLARGPVLLGEVSVPRARPRLDSEQRAKFVVELWGCTEDSLVRAECEPPPAPDREVGPAGRVGVPVSMCCVELTTVVL